VRSVAVLHSSAFATFAPARRTFLGCCSACAPFCNAFAGSGFATTRHLRFSSEQRLQRVVRFYWFMVCARFPHRHHTRTLTAQSGGAACWFYLPIPMPLLAILNVGDMVTTNKRWWHCVTRYAYYGAWFFVAWCPCWFGWCCRRAATYESGAACAGLRYLHFTAPRVPCAVRPAATQQTLRCVWCGSGLLSRASRILPLPAVLTGSGSWHGCAHMAASRDRAVWSGGSATRYDISKRLPHTPALLPPLLPPLPTSSSCDGFDIARAVRGGFSCATANGTDQRTISSGRGEGCA